MFRRERARASGVWQRVGIGSEIGVDSEIRVNGKDDYIVLGYPDGSEVRLMGLSSILIKDIMTETGSKKTGMLKLLAGQLTAKVQKDQNWDFKVSTDTAVAAVRGTSFGMAYNGGKGNVSVFGGQVAVSDPSGKTPEVLVNPGQYTSFDLDKTPTTAIEIPAEVMKTYEQALNLKVPDFVKDGVKPDDSGKTTTGGKVTIPNVTTGGGDKGATGASTEPAQGGLPFPLGWAISSESIDGKIWKKILLSPEFKFGDVTLALYLPVYFQNMDDILDGRTWYNYKEWNFGTGAGDFDWLDIIHDLLLKIRYFGYESKTTTIKFGSIPDITIGHGILVNGYANDLQFPKERKIGFEFGWDFGVWGFETMMGDVFQTKLMSGRVYVRPLFGQPIIGNIGIGVSGLVDLDPLANGQSKLYGYAADVDFPLFDFGAVSMTLYADIGQLGYQNGTVNPWFDGYGYNAGLMGKILIIDYKAEFRSYNGGFMGSYVDRFYDVNKSASYQILVSGSTPNYNGFIIQAGTKLPDMGGATLSYEQLFTTPDPMNLLTSTPRNFMHIEAYIDQKLFKKGYGKIMYDRKDFAAADFFDKFLGNGVMLTTQVYYEISEGAYIGLIYKRYYETDSAGAIVPKDTYGLETQFGL